MAKIAITVNCILNWSNEFAHMLVMQTLDKKISFPIIIAGNEAAGLLKELENVKVKRPQTHDLFFSTIQTFDIQIEEVYIHELIEGIFYTKLICSTHGKTVELDARPSDAIILAIKANAPVFVEDTILDKLGMPTHEMEKQIISPQEYNQQAEDAEEDYPLDNWTTQKLTEMLNIAIETENFEMASQIRDVLNQRKK